MDSQFPEPMMQRLQRCGIVAVLVVDEASSVVPLCKALVACGIDCVELTLRTETALESVRLLREEVPEVLVGVGTVLRCDQVDAALKAGAEFAVAPGLNADVVLHAQDCSLPFAPGVVTPSDIESAIQLGCRELKFFPAEPSGGIRYLRTMAAPYAHLGLQFIPLGGLTADNMNAYLYDPIVPAIGGSWIAPRKLIQTQNWSAVIDNATEARRNLQELRAQ